MRNWSRVHFLIIEFEVKATVKWERERAERPRRLRGLHLSPACIQIRLRTTTPTQTTTTSGTTLHPWHCRCRLPSCSARAHRRGSRSRREGFGIQSALEEDTQHLVLRRARRAPENRQRQCVCTSWEAEAPKGGTRLTAIDLRQRTLDPR